MDHRPLIAPSSALTKPNMGLRDLLSPPRRHRRARSKAGSEVGPIEDTGEVHPFVPRHAGSTPDLGITPSTFLPSGPSTSQDQGLSGMQTVFSRAIHPITFCSRNIGHHTITGRIRSVFRTGRSQNSNPSNHEVDPSTVDKDKPDWKSTTYATTKLAIHMVKESSDAFPPLKSVAGGLSAILTHCDV